MTRRTQEQYNWGKLEFDETILDYIKGYPRRTTSRGGSKIEAIVIHHMAMVGKGDGSAADACIRTWRTRAASAHYCVDGKNVRQTVWDSMAAWAVGNLTWNKKTISIEHANETGKPKWKVSRDTFDTGAKLVAYLCWVYKLGRPKDGKNVRPHRDFTGTECPGPFLGGSEWKEYIAAAQRHYDGIAGNPVKPDTKPKPDGAVKHYIVRAGDTLSKIARQFNTTVAKIVGWNKIKDPNKIEVGQDLIVSESVVAPTPSKPTDKLPSSIYSLRFWKLTLPKGKPDEIKQPKLNGYKDQFFHVVEHPVTKRLGIAFRAYCGGSKTENTTYTRCEGREMWKGGKYDESEWGNDKAGEEHIMEGEFYVTHAAKNKPHGVVAQCHDDKDDIVMLRYEGIDSTHGKLYAEWSKGKGNGSTRELIATISTYQIVQYKIVAKYKDGFKVYLNGAKEPASKRAISRKGCYWKHGAYNQARVKNDKPYKPDAENDYFEAVHLSNKVTHNGKVAA
jgi:LysM repeat protein